MAEADNIENRVSRLEREVPQVREQAEAAHSDAEAARLLAAGADRDVSEVRSELRAHRQVLSALRETQLEMGTALSEMDGRLQTLQTEQAGLRTDLNDLRGTVLLQGRQMSDGFATMHEGFGTVHAGMRGITMLLERAIDTDPE